jgi:hypothetical protein
VRGASQARRHLLRESVADGLHSMRVPALVRPSAPCGVQNAPGCTPLRTVLVVCVGRGVAFFVAGRTVGRFVVGRGDGFVVGTLLRAFAAVVVGAAVVGGGCSAAVVAPVLAADVP